MWQCLDKVVAIAGGCVVAAGGLSGLVDPGTAIGGVVAASQLIGLFSEKAAKHGLDSAGFLTKIRLEVIRAIGEPPVWVGIDGETIDSWDRALAKALPNIEFDRDALAKAMFDASGFENVASQLILAQLAKIDPLFGSSPAKDFARNVIVIALKTALLDKEYFISLRPQFDLNLAENVGAIREKTEATHRDVQELNEKLDRYMAAVEGAGLSQQAALQGISEVTLRHAVRQMVERLGGDDLADDGLVTWLEEWIESTQQKLAQQSNEGAAFDAARGEAERLFREGQTASASDPLISLLRSAREEAESRQLRILDEAIAFDLLGLELDSAVEKLKMIPGVAATKKPVQIAMMFEQRGLSYLTSDPGSSNIVNILFSIEALRLALSTIELEDQPFIWTRMQANLGEAFLRLGQRESGTDRLKAAADCYSLALDPLKFHGDAVVRADIQADFAMAIQEIGLREGRIELREQAVAIYKELSKFYAKEQHPNWAINLLNLGNSLISIGDSDKDNERLKQGIQILNQSLLHFSRPGVSYELSKILIAIGSGYARLARRINAIENYTKAAEAYRLALKGYSREAKPFLWAMTQNNLGLTLVSLSEYKKDRNSSEEAIAAFRSALEEVDRARAPDQWAMLKSNLANALWRFGRSERDMQALEEALDTYESVSEERNRVIAPFEWSQIQFQIGNVYTEIGAISDNVTNFEKALEYYNLSLEEIGKEQSPLLWADVQNSIGNALLVLGARRRNTDEIEQAVETLRSALFEISRKELPERWTLGSANLGNALLELAVRRKDCSIMAAAYRSFHDALKEATSAGNGMMIDFASDGCQRVKLDASKIGCVIPEQI